jgi:Protein of unknown function (DUF1579)
MRVIRRAKPVFYRDRYVFSFGMELFRFLLVLCNFRKRNLWVNELTFLKLSYKEQHMKRFSSRCGLFIILCITLLSSISFSQESMSGDKKMPSQEEMMARWKASMTPGDMHKKLEIFVGSWNTEVKVWMNGHNSMPAVSKGTARYSLIYGGRYLKQEFKGEMMGRPYAGLGYTAYDNMKKKYTGTWIDNMGTSISTMEGTLDDGETTLTLTGKMDEPMTGEMNRDVKYVLHIIDKNKHVFEAYDDAMGAEPTMQITYTRKK